ncbi:esterase/lipase family protein [Candidatus Omnitrophota bacterium]
MKNKYLLISVLCLLCCVVFLCEVQAQENKEALIKRKHVIFLIHGIGGNKTHFGFMDKALPKILNKKDPSTKYIVQSIEYDTGNDEKTPYLFAQDIDLQIKKVTASAKFKPQDKISFIMHSQGGLVGSIWLFQSMMKTPGYSTPEVIKHVDAFITLGTPFWGAKSAQWGSEAKAFADLLGVSVPLPYGKQELEQMAFGSDMIYDFRMAMLDPQYQKIINILKTQVRFLNIVGVADVLNPLGIFVSGTNKYEDDGAVPLASARFNFLYSQDLGLYQHEAILSLDHGREIIMAPYVIVNAVHRSPLPEFDKAYGIAQIPKDCINNDACTHPTFPYLWKQLLAQEIVQMDDLLGDFKTFLIDLNVRVQNGQEAMPQCRDIHVTFYKLDGSPLNEANIDIAKFYEFYNKGARKSQKYANHCRYYFTGSIHRSLEHRQEAVLMKVEGDGLKTRFIEVPLKESYSTFIDINMASLDDVRKKEE